MLRISGLCLAVVLLFVHSASAQSTPNTVVRDPQAVVLLQRALAALGGAAPTSIVATGSYVRFVDDSTVSYPLRVEALGTDKFRWEIDTPENGTVATTVSGTVGLLQSAQGTEAIPIGEIPGKAFESFPVLALSLWVNSATTSVTLVGADTLAGTAVEHISITPSLTGSAGPHHEQVYETTHRREIFLNQQTSVPVGVRYYAHPTDWRSGIAVDLVFTDFRTVNGLLFPFKITRYLNGQKVSAIQYDSITLNSTLNESDFSVETSQ